MMKLFFVSIYSNETVEITAINQPIPIMESKIRVIKKDFDNGDLLSGAVFGVYKLETDEKIYEIETSINGDAETPIFPVGSYYLKELKSPDGYELSSEKYGVKVKAGEITEITVTNKKIAEPELEIFEGKIKLIKKDKDNGNLLSNAVFGVYRATDDVKISESETDSNGETVSSLLPIGDYYLKELKSPDGYELSSEKYGVTVKADEVTEITVTNKKITEPISENKFKIIKKDKDNGNLLSNAVFGVYRAIDDVKISELETDSNGEAISPLLPISDYYLKELKAPDKYKISIEKYGVTVIADKIVEITITNIKEAVPTTTQSPTTTTQTVSTSTSVTPLGTQILILGFLNVRFPTALFTKYLIIFSVTV